MGELRLLKTKADTLGTLQMLKHETPCWALKSALLDRHSCFGRSLAGLLKISALGIVFYSTLGAFLMLMHEKPCLIPKSPRGRHLSFDFPSGRPYLRLSVCSSDGISVPGFLSTVLVKLLVYFINLALHTSRLIT